QIPQTRWPSVWQHRARSDVHRSWPPCGQFLRQCSMSSPPPFRSMQTALSLRENSERRGIIPLRVNQTSTHSPASHKGSTREDDQSRTTTQTDYAAFLIGVSFAGDFMGGAAATSGSSPQIHESNRVTTQPKPVMILPNNSTMPMLAIQLLKSHAQNMIAPLERG